MLGGPMRIAYLFSRYPALSHTFCDTEMHALKQAGVDLEIDVIRPPLTSFRHSAVDGVEIFYAPPPPVLRAFEQRARREGRFPETLVREHTERFGEVFKPAQRARNALYFAATLPGRGITQIHVHFGNRAAYTAMLIQSLCGLPFSVTVHGQDFMSDLGSPLLLDAICQQAAFIVAVSDFTCELLARQCPSAAGKIVRVHNGIDANRFPFHAPAERRVPLLVTVGRLVPLKGHVHLLDACAQLRDEGVEVHCEIVGDGPERAKLEAHIERRKLTGLARLTGPLTQEEVAARLAAATAFVLPSIVEASGATDILPTVVLEAMASGRPVVASQVGGVPELIAQETSGILVPPGDVGALAKAVRRLLSEPCFARSLAAAARDRVEKHFRPAAAAESLRGLFAKSGAPARSAVAAAPKTPTFAYLIPHWPPPGLHLHAELSALRAAHPAMKIYIARVALHRAAEPEDEPVFDAATFLPDGMVLEGDWQRDRALARDLERWRNETLIEADEYLAQARWVPWLRQQLAAANVRHLHIAGSGGLPAGWMLQKLTGISLSSTLEAHPPRPPSQLQYLMGGALVVRTQDAVLLEGEDGRFERDVLSAPRRFFGGSASREALRAWGERLQRFAAG